MEKAIQILVNRADELISKGQFKVAALAIATALDRIGDDALNNELFNRAIRLQEKLKHIAGESLPVPPGTRCPNCKGTGRYRATQKCFGCKGKGFQNQSDIDRNRSYWSSKEAQNGQQVTAA